MNSNVTKGVILPLLICFALQLGAQSSRSIHQSFEIDSVEHIQLDLYGEYEISLWEGNTILTETHIELSDASPNILKHFVKLGRYHIDVKTQPGSAFFTHRDGLRKPIYTQDGQAWEFVKLKIYIPDVFSSPDNKTFTIVKESKAEARAN